MRGLERLDVLELGLERGHAIGAASELGVAPDALRQDIGGRGREGEGERGDGVEHRLL